MEKHLHIIALTIPFPVDYGGVYDLFYKLVSLHKEGIQIHLHCFEYGERKQQEELHKYCTSVQYYPRSSFFSTLFSGLPFIVSSRANSNLLNNLLQDNYPILMEGIHGAFLLKDKRFNGRKKILRLHNVEYEYYKDLSQATTSFAKKLFFKREQKLLYKFEKTVAAKADSILAVTEKDVKTYQQEFGAENIRFMPLFLPDYWTINCLKGKGSYCLYQGDLSVISNEKAALWLIGEVFAGTKHKLLIAGKIPSSILFKAAAKKLNVMLIANPVTDQMQDFIKLAHINILPSYSNTGIKLKLLNALYNGRFCLVNELTAGGSGVKQLCYFFENAATCKQKVNELLDIEFTQSDINNRKQVLSTAFNNDENAKVFIERELN